MKEAKITSIKRALVDQIRPLFGKGCSYKDTPAVVSIQQLDSPLVAVSSDESTLFSEQSSDVFTCKTIVTVDAYMPDASTLETDLLAQNVVEAVTADRTLAGTVHNLVPKQIIQKTFQEEHRVKVLMFDFEVVYHLEGRREKPDEIGDNPQVIWST